MEQVLASALSGYSVMTTSGSEPGRLENVTVDLHSGELRYLRVDPTGHADGGFERTDDDRLLVPAAAVTATNDYLLVEPTE